MADEKKYTAREAAFAVLAKAHEMLAKSEVVKSEKLCKDHMGIEKAEGYEPVQKSDCMKCNMKKPSPSTGQGDLLSRPAPKAKWQMDKAEAPMMPAAKPLGGTGVGAPSTPTSKPDAGFGKVIAKSDEGVGSKKIGYKPSKLGEEEKEPQAEDKAFQQKGIDHKSSNDPRMGATPAPDANPKEHAEGNNAQPGSKPSVEANHSQDTQPIKGHLKLAKFVGRMEHKRSMRGAPAAAPEMDKAQTGHEKGVHKQHVPARPDLFPKEKSKGVSRAGVFATQGDRTSKDTAKRMHGKVLDEMKAQPKPKLPR